MSINRHSVEWMQIKKRSVAQIEKHRLELESLLCEPDRAQQLRGMIHALTDQIEEVEPTPTPEVKDTNYG